MSGKKLNPLLRLLLRFGPRIMIRKLALSAKPAARSLPFPRCSIVLPDYSLSPRFAAQDCSFSGIQLGSALDFPVETLTRDCPVPEPRAAAVPGLDFRNDNSAVFSVSLMAARDVKMRGLSWILPRFEQNRPVPCFFPTRTLALKTHFKTGIRSDTARIESLTLSRKALSLELFPTEFQLDFWRRAVLRTRLEPREFTLLGVFGAIPAAGVNLSYDAGENRLKFVPGAKKTLWKKYNEVAVFRKNSDQSLLVVSAGE